MVKHGDESWAKSAPNCSWIVSCVTNLEKEHTFHTEIMAYYIEGQYMVRNCRTCFHTTLPEKKVHSIMYEINKMP